MDIDGTSLLSQKSKPFYENVKLDYQHLEPKKQMEALRKDPFLNALQVKYAYAMTCHKSQGGSGTVFSLIRVMLQKNDGNLLIP